MDGRRSLELCRMALWRLIAMAWGHERGVKRSGMECSGAMYLDSFDRPAFVDALAARSTA
jgi:hypothetical protein